MTISFTPDTGKALPNLKEATSLAKTTNAFGVLAFEHDFYWIVWDDFDLGIHTTPIQKWGKPKRREVKINKADEDMITSERAKEVFQRLVTSGLVPLYVKYQTIDLAGKKIPRNLSVKTLEECIRANQLFSYDVPVFTAGDLYTGWCFFPEKSGLDDFAPTIAQLMRG